MQPIYKEIAPDVERALGEVMLAECKGRNVPAWTIASRAEFAQSTVKAFTRGKRQPKLATFIALAWAQSRGEKSDAQSSLAEKCSGYCTAV